jgi:hypothetical protein
MCLFWTPTPSPRIIMDVIWRKVKNGKKKTRENVKEK